MQIADREPALGRETGAETSAGREKRERLVAAIETYTALRGHSPTVRELGALVGLNTSSAHGHLAVLRRQGVIDWDRSRPRTIRLVPNLERDESEGG